MAMESLSVIWMDLLVDGQQSLIVLLAEDGTVNRLGNGTDGEIQFETAILSMGVPGS